MPQVAWAPDVRSLLGALKNVVIVASAHDPVPVQFEADNLTPAGYELYAHPFRAGERRCCSPQVADTQERCAILHGNHERTVAWAHVGAGVRLEQL